MHTEFQLPVLFRSADVGLNPVGNPKVSMKWMASLAPARAEDEAGVVAKADQYHNSY